jgi:hypothetical protein
MTTQSQSQSQTNSGATMTRQSPSELQDTMLLGLATAIPSPRGDVSTDGAVLAMCNQLGIQVDAWGVVESQASKPNWTRYNGVRAIRFLDASGYIKKPKRGRYGLTQKGWEKARELGFSASEPVVEQVTEPVTEPVTETVGQSTDQVTHTGSGLSFEDLFSNLTDSYHDDEYIVGLAIEQTNCFGFHAERSPTCRECPLARSCKKAWLADLTEIARQLDGGDEVVVEEPEPVVEEQVARKPDSIVVDDPHAVRKEVGVEYTTVITPIDTTCSKCGKALPQGSEGISQWGKQGVFCSSHLVG